MLAEGNSVTQYLNSYSSMLQTAIQQLSAENLEKVLVCLEKTIERQARIYVAGNGGSAAIADHLCCDWTKGVHIPDRPGLRVHSLIANTPVFTALANDFSWGEAFSKQVEMFCDSSDVLILISSSGNSENIIQAALAAKKKKILVIGLSGFDGGKLKNLSDISLHIPVNNYGIVEDAHQMTMHVLAQYLAKTRDVSFKL